MKPKIATITVQALLLRGVGIETGDAISIRASGGVRVISSTAISGSTASIPRCVRKSVCGGLATPSLHSQLLQTSLSLFLSLSLSLSLDSHVSTAIYLSVSLGSYFGWVRAWHRSTRAAPFVHHAFTCVPHLVGSLLDGRQQVGSARE